MSMFIVHFAVGFTAAMLAAQALDRGPSIGIATVSGAWALVPGTALLLPDGALREALVGLLFQTHLGDLFWFHQTITAVDPGGGLRPHDGSHLVGAFGFALLLIGAAYVDLKRADIESPGEIVDVLGSAASVPDPIPDATTLWETLGRNPD